MGFLRLPRTPEQPCRRPHLHHLLHDLRRGEVAQKPHAPRVAELAVHCAAHLRRVRVERTEVKQGVRRVGEGPGSEPALEKHESAPVLLLLLQVLLLLRLLPHRDSTERLGFMVRR
jgi:hypothetical protein